MAGKTTGSLPPINPKDEIDNPFKLPSDDQIFRLREEEKLKREEDRQKQTTMKVWEKVKTKTSRSDRMKELVGDTQVMTLTDVPKTVSQKVAVQRRPEKENMAEFIAKKREMFLVQMSLDTKRDEIRKLEEKAQMKEDALQRSEQMLEEDVMRFDAFLRENDAKAREAMKKAEEEAKRKQEKAQEIKRLMQQIQALNSEMSKHRESLEDCLKYKAFLDSLTPPEWFEQHKRNLEDRRLAIQKERHDKKYKEWESIKRSMFDKRRAELEQRKSERKGKKKKGQEEEEEEEERRFRASIPAAPKLEDEIVPPIAEEPPMYFTEPHQLMDIFAALEEQNLFLIQNSQETQYTVDELRQAFRKTKADMDSRTGALQTQIDDLQGQIAAEEHRSELLQEKRLAAASGAGAGGASDGAGNGNGNTKSQQEKERLLTELNSKVLSVYQACGYDASSKPSTLVMLSQMESKLETLLAAIDTMPSDYVIKAEKEKEKRRRERKREEQQALQERLQEERNRRAIERSMQAPKKRVGRMVMSRSRPVRKGVDRNDDDGDKGNDDELRFLGE